MIEWLLAALFMAWLGAPPPGPAAAPARVALTRPLPTAGSDLDRIAFAVEGAESSHGRDPLMWQPNRRGPQGPMQVSQAAALDVGGGNRFDPIENRQLGQAYLADMFRRYGNWRDAVAAYNWGPANLDRWIAAGRPDGGVSAPVLAYIERIMREFRGGPGSGAATPAAVRPVTPPVEPPPPPTISDTGLRNAFERNSAAIKQLQGFLDGSEPEGGAVLTAMRSISGRPGYEEFKTLRPAKQHAPSAATMRAIAGVLLAKMQAENAAIVLVDQGRRGKVR